jgi:DNA-binding transcriptional ArsR family regulator
VRAGWYRDGMTNNNVEAEDESATEDDEAPATPAETRETYLSRSRSGYGKVRRAFVQAPATVTKGSQPGTLARFNRNHRAAVLYLALLSNWPWLSREEDPLPAGAWIRFLTSEKKNALTWTPQSLSHAWGVLETLNLIERPRKGRLVAVRPRREDGESDYLPPSGAGDSYLVLPDQFWTEQFHGTLSWPALVVLLILLKETGLTAEAELPVDRAKAWYGISRTTAEQGLTDLRALGLVVSRDRRIKDVNASGGHRLTSQHRLTGPFSTKARSELRAEATERVQKRNPVPKPVVKEKDDGDEAE